MKENLDLKQNFGIDAEHELILILTWQVMKFGGAASNSFRDRIYGQTEGNRPVGLWSFKNHLGEIDEEVIFIR